MSSNVPKFDTAPTRGYSNRAAPHWVAGLENPLVQGAKAMRRQVHGFFHTYTVLVDGVLGGIRACRFLDPVSQPDTSSIALGLRTPVDGLNHQSRSYP